MGRCPQKHNQCTTAGNKLQLAGETLETSVFIVSELTVYLTLVKSSLHHDRTAQKRSVIGREQRFNSASPISKNATQIKNQHLSKTLRLY